VRNRKYSPKELLVPHGLDSTAEGFGGDAKVTFNWSSPRSAIFRLVQKGAMGSKEKRYGP